MLELKGLQNGSDIRGVAIEGVAGEEINLTNRAVALISAAFADWINIRTSKIFYFFVFLIGICLEFIIEDWNTLIVFRF